MNIVIDVFLILEIMYLPIIFEFNKKYKFDGFFADYASYCMV